MLLMNINTACSDVCLYFNPLKKHQNANLQVINDSSHERPLWTTFHH